jgi:hypothetical protein
MTFDANEFWAGNLIVQHHTQQTFQNITQVTMTYYKINNYESTLLFQKFKSVENRTVGY